MKFYRSTVVATLLLGILFGCITKGYDGEPTEYWNWTKWIEYFERNEQHHQWAQEARRGASDQKQQLLNLMQWTRSKVAYQPEGIPYKELHIATVVERGYGKSKDQAEVFTLLAAYLCYEISWGVAQSPGSARDKDIALSFVNGERGWMVFDVTHGGWFETSDGHIATIEDFEGQARPLLHVEGDVKKRIVGDAIEGDQVPYRAYFSNLRKIFETTSPSRARAQMPYHRALQIVGLEEEG
jgi:hypothetical protein